MICTKLLNSTTPCFSATTPYSDPLNRTLLIVPNCTSKNTQIYKYNETFMVSKYFG